MLRVGLTQGLEAPAGFPCPIGQGLSGARGGDGRAALRRRLSRRVPESQRRLRSAEGTPDLSRAAIKIGTEVVGVLTFNTTDPRTYDAEEMAYLTSFAAQAAIAIENARLYEAAQRELVERARAEATSGITRIGSRRSCAAASNWRRSNPGKPRRCLGRRALAC